MHLRINTVSTPGCLCKKRQEKSDTVVFFFSCSLETAETDSLLDDFVFLPSGMHIEHMNDEVRVYLCMSL